MEPEDRDTQQDFNLLQAAADLRRHRRLLLTLVAVALVVATAYALLAPKTFTATSRLIVPQEKTISLGNGLGELIDLARGGLEGASGELYVGVLASRSVAEPLIDRFDLVAHYEVAYRQDAYDALREHMEARFDSQQSIVTLEVSDRSPEWAANLANALVDELQKRLVELNLSSAARERAFLEERLAQARTSLRAAEDALQEFQQEHGAFKLDEQARAAIEALGRLQGELASKEIEAGVLRGFQTERNPELQALLAETAQIRRQIEKLRRAEAEGTEGLLASGDLPDLAVRYGRLLREYKLQEALFESLARQYELARVQEVKTTTSLQVLDRAVPPERRSAPRRTFIVVLAVCVAFFLGVTGILAYEAWRRALAPPASEAPGRPGAPPPRPRE